MKRLIMKNIQGFFIFIFEICCKAIHIDTIRGGPFDFWGGFEENVPEQSIYFFQRLKQFFYFSSSEKQIFFFLRTKDKIFFLALIFANLRATP